MLVAAACAGTPFGRRLYEYEEEIYLDVDGTATVNVNASVPSLVALRGADLPVDPVARLDRDRVRAFFSGPGASVTRVTLSRRDGRRFVHVSIDVDDVRRLSRTRPFAWSSYRLDRRDDALEFRQVVGTAAGRDVGDVGWTGDEAVRFRVHVPSEIPFHNSPSGVERGNILGWDQPLAERVKGTPLEMEFQMEPESILYSTLLLFGGTIVAAGWPSRSRSGCSCERPAGRHYRIGPLTSFVVSRWSLVVSNRLQLLQLGRGFRRRSSARS